MPDQPSFTLPDALQALQALRHAANLPPEQFPLPAFIGMISDEIQALREQGRSDQQIADLIRQHSPISIDPSDIHRFYATPEERHQHG